MVCPTDSILEKMNAIVELFLPYRALYLTLTLSSPNKPNG